MQIHVFSRDELLGNFWEIQKKAAGVFGDKKLIVTRDGAVSFEQVDRFSNSVYLTLKELNPETKLGVGLFLNDPREIVPCMMGVLKTNHYFIPLDVLYPASTILDMIELSGIQIILTNNEFIDQVSLIIPRNILVINIDDIHRDKTPSESLSFTFNPEDRVQILFTSGSTGKQKGAIEDYRFLMRSIALKLAHYEYDPDERILQTSTFSFGGPHSVAFTALLTGVTLCYHPIKYLGIASLPNWIREQKITLYSSTPTVFRSFMQIIADDETFPSVTAISFGGEKRFYEDIVQGKKHFPNLKKIRLGYNATETQGIAVKVYPADFPFSKDFIPSGIPYNDINIIIRDEHGNPQPVGAEGEIIVHGNSLAQGYLNSPELTKERFSPDSTNSEWQYFKTGDLGKLLPDGQLVHLGRLDNMVKIKGIRVELNSIDQNIRSYPGISQAFTKAITDSYNRKRLVSYFMPEKGVKIPVSDMRKHLITKMPMHHIPTFLMEMENIPMLANGKVDSNNLPLPTLTRPALTNPYIAPNNATELRIVSIWEELIGVSGIGIADDFFEIGGDSLIGVLILASFEEEYGIDLPASIFLTHSTIQQQASLIASKDDHEKPVEIVKLHPWGKKTPIIFIPGKGGYPTRIQNLAKYLNKENPIYAFQNLKRRNRSGIYNSVESAAKHFGSILQSMNIIGPLILIGESAGGKIAYELSQRIVANGGEMPLLFLLDTYNFEKSIKKELKKGFKLPYYFMLIKKHLSIIFGSNSDGRMEYFRFYANIIKNKLVRFHNGFRYEKSNFIGNIPARLSRIEKQSKLIDFKYQVRPYPGTVILIKATRGKSGDQISNGWDQVELGELILHKLDCYHGSILFEPAVSELAKIIQSHISGE
jgi:acyl-coenzyme A synthetase/AMP-(fatty) acid ligase/thioesterase domain-containing protein/acyl carrier protein